jgi:hypothetical protein
MYLPEAYLAERLSRSLPTTDGGTLVTVADAYQYWTTLSDDRQLRQTWQCTWQLMLDGASAREVTYQLQVALFIDAKLDFGRCSGSSARLWNLAANSSNATPA